MFAKAFELYDKLLNIYKTQYDKLTKAQKKIIKVKNIPKNLTIDLYLHGHDDDLPQIPQLEGDEEELNEGKALKVLTPKKLLTRLLILLAQIKAENNLYKSKNIMIKMLHLLYQHNKITKKVYNNLFM